MSYPASVFRKAIEVLLVEDNPADVGIMKEIVKHSRFTVYLSVAKDGLQALEMLRQSQDFGGKDKPDMIILDLNLPRLTGHEVLTLLRRDPDLMHIPVLIMSHSQADEDLQKAYENDANFYMAKPMDIEHFAGVMDFIDKFFFEKMDKAPE